MDRWDVRWSEAAPAEPSAFVTTWGRHLPRSGRALDVAGGIGRHALWLARHGLDVVLVDRSAVAVRRAAEAAARAGLQVQTIRADLETEGLPAGPFDVILCHHYLQRDLFAAWPTALAPGGCLLFCQPTLVNLERHERPSRRHLLAPGELAGLVEGLEVVRLEEGWADDRHEARLLARRPPAQTRSGGA